MALVWGAEYQFDPNAMGKPHCCRVANDKYVVAYVEGFNSRIVVGTVAGNVITFGAPKLYTAGQTTAGPNVCFLDDNKFVVIFADTIVGPMHGQARVGIITGTNIAWGAPVTFQANWVDKPSSCNIGVDKFAIAYWDENNKDCVTCICSVVGNVITAGAPVIFLNAAGGTAVLSTTRWADDKFATAYLATIVNNLEIFITTVVGLVPTFHAETNFQNFSVAAQFINGLAKVSDNEFAIAWRRGAGGADPNNAHCIRMGNVTGNIVTAGPYYVLNPFPEYTDYSNVQALTTNPAQFIVIYPNSVAPLQRGIYNILDFTGTTITNFGAKQIFIPAQKFGAPTSTNLLNGKLAIAFKDTLVGNQGDGMIGIFLNLPAVTTDPATGVT